MAFFNFTNKHPVDVLSAADYWTAFYSAGLANHRRIYPSAPFRSLSTKCSLILQERAMLVRVGFFSG